VLRSRIIPCLLVHNGGLVKTVNFRSPKYVGDPINAVKIFNEKEVDELMVIDIDATAQGKEPNLQLIENLAAECRMPLCYGGGVKTARQAEKIISLGVEKVALSSALVENPSLAGAISAAVGCQSVVCVLDVKKSMFGKYSVVVNNSQTNTHKDPVEVAKTIAAFGIGELAVNSIDRDGTMTGYDLTLADKMRDAVDVPITILGGASSLEDINNLIQRFTIIGAAAGSLFVFKGKYRAVLINYPKIDLRRPGTNPRLAA
jgi:imidazole glycerol-phosphate synthase subunit HisF